MRSRAVAERITAAQSAQLQRELSSAPATYDQLVVSSGMSKPRLARWVKSNRENLYVAEWTPDRNGRPFVPAFAWGPGRKDAPRPGRALTAAEQMRKTRAARRTASTQ